MRNIEDIIEEEFANLNLGKDKTYSELSDKILKYESEIKDKLNDVALVNKLEFAVDDLEVYEQKLLIKFTLDFIRKIFYYNNKNDN